MDINQIYLDCSFGTVASDPIISHLPPSFLRNGFWRLEVIDVLVPFRTELFLATNMGEGSGGVRRRAEEEQGGQAGGGGGGQQVQQEGEAGGGQVGAGVPGHVLQMLQQRQHR